MSDSSAPNPALFNDFVNGFQRSAAIRAAVDLDLFTAIAAGASTDAAIAERAAASERGVRILCDYLTASGFLTKADGEYALTADSAAYLDRRSPSYLGGVVGFLQNETQRRNFSELTETVRRGTVPAEREDAFNVEHGMWVEFARSMSAMMAPFAEFIAEKLIPANEGATRILDVAAGHGLFGVAAARRHPRAEVTALDWPGVLSVARENAEKANVIERWRALEGDAFRSDLEGPYDVILLTNFLHHFDRAACVELLRKLHAAAAPGGRVVTLEFIPNDDRVSPAPAAMFALVMLANTPAGDAYTFDEYRSMFEEAGFASSELIDPGFGVQRLLVSRA